MDAQQYRRGSDDIGAVAMTTTSVAAAAAAVAAAAAGSAVVSRESSSDNKPTSRVSISQLIEPTVPTTTTTARNSSSDTQAAAEALDTLRGSGGGRGHFIQRVQAIPLVNSALGMYDRTKEANTMFRVGSNVIESGVRRMCEPITKRIDVTQLDTFACRQLDNLGYTAGEGSSSSSNSRNNRNINNYNTNANIGSSNLRKRTKDQAEQFSNSSSSNNNNGDIDIDIDIDDNGKNKHGARDMVPLMAEESTEQAHQPGRWRMVNLMASAKERALAYREDTMRRLKYCLDWIIYATALLNQHMHDLRELLSSLRDGARIMFSDTAPEYVSVATVGERGAEAPLVDVRGAAVRLGRARKEIVGTVTRAVGVISQYAGSVLPGEARRQVRGLILGLPGRFGAADPVMASAGSSVGSPSVASTGGSPMGSPRQHPADVRPADVEATARRTLALASESFVMLGSLQKVFSNLYGNAERWIGGAQQPVPVPVPVEAVAGPAYREPLSSASLAGATSAASTGSVPVRRPPRRLPPMNMTPVNTAVSTAAEADGSLVEIGERMRRMDMVHSADTGDRTAADTGPEVSYKRNRTREPTPS